MAVTSCRKISFPSIHLDYLTDYLHGRNVRHYNYLDLSAPIQPSFCWTVFIWEDGLDYDADGNAYFDDYPEWYPHSSHCTQKDAEIQAAYLENLGFKPEKIMVDCAPSRH